MVNKFLLLLVYNYLYDNNVRPDGEIVIHAWYFSHGHGDHYGAFHDFANGEYADLVTLAYRQFLAAHKLALDETGELIYNCSLHGCRASVFGKK